MTLEKFETKVAQGRKRIFAEFTYEAAKISGGLKTSLSDSTSSAQHEVANCVAMFSNRLASVFGT